ncbi:MAG: AbrB family transcriptional regulator [archaeon GB-1867-035]|nr:AbrB family transcriptional regulator [Candidatus Culexmicrobium profundum]
MGYSIVYMDDRGRVLIPKDLRAEVKSKVFTVKISEDGAIILQPIINKAQKLAGKYKNLLQNKNYEELEEIQEKFIRKERGI